MSIRYYHRGIVVLLSMATLGIIIIALAYLSSSDIDTIWMKNVIIPLSLALIALAAVGIAVWQGFETRRYNRKSVKPYLEVNYDLVPTEPVKIIIKNQGIGPAFITKITCDVDGTTFDAFSLETLNACFKAAALTSGLPAKILKSGKVIIDLPKTAMSSKGEFFNEWLVFSPGDVFSAGEERVLLSSGRQDNLNDELRTVLVKIVRRIAIVIEYNSIYDEQFKAVGRSNIA